MIPPLGFIRKRDRSSEQHDAATRAEASMLPRLGLPVPTLKAGQKVCLFDAWKASAVVADVGFVFPRFHQLTGSCFPSGTPVRLADGSEKPIEDVTVGDQVVTHTGRSRSVVETMQRPYSGVMVTLNVSGFPFPLEMTADHQVAILPGRCKWRWQPGELEWKRADEIEEGDHVVLGWSRQDHAPAKLDTATLLGPQVVVLDELMKDHAYTKGCEPDCPHANLPSARQMVRRSGINWEGRVRLHRSRVENAIFRHIPICPSFARLIGLYLAEGGTDAGRVVFTLNSRETALAAEILALVRGLFGVEGEELKQRERPNTLKVRFTNQNLATVFEAVVPGNVYSKRVPGLFFHADEETRLALLLGWMAGDGYAGIKEGKRPGNVRITGVSVCAGLARDMTTLALSCGLRATCGRRKARRASKLSYSVDLTGPKAVRLFSAVAHRAETSYRGQEDTARTQYGYARKVRTIERRSVTMLPVYDFEVEEDHSFIAGGLVVHNCVGAGGGQALFTLIAVQRLLAASPTKAFIPFWPFDYGRCRFNEGDRGEGEGAMGSSFAATVVKEGVIAATGPNADPNLPPFQNNDGLVLTSKLEMQWSDGGSALVTAHMQSAAQHVVGSAAPCKSPADIKAAILNGYPVTFACDNYIGHASVQGSGADAAVCGYWDGSGGHQQSIHAYWENATLGPLYWAQNNWPGNTYPSDPAGGPVCGCWVTEAHVQAAFRLDAEVYALSHLTWFPSQPDVIDWGDLI
jgi:hypothetical protein